MKKKTNQDGLDSKCGEVYYYLVRMPDYNGGPRDVYRNDLFVSFGQDGLARRKAIAINDALERLYPSADGYRVYFKFAGSKMSDIKKTCPGVIVHIKPYEICWKELLIRLNAKKKSRKKRGRSRVDCLVDLITTVIKKSMLGLSQEKKDQINRIISKFKIPPEKLLDFYFGESDEDFAEKMLLRERELKLFQLNGEIEEMRRSVKSAVVRLEEFLKNERLDISPEGEVFLFGEKILLKSLGNEAKLVYKTISLLK